MEELVSELLNSRRSDTVIFKHSDEDYKKSMLDFSLDIVSLWNTPRREQAYIVCGVLPSDAPPHMPVGLRTRTSDDFYQSQFLGYMFQKKPQFEYKEVVHNSKRLGIFIIQNSRGSGSPCVVASNDMSPHLQKNQLWARKNGNNLPLPASDFLVVEIHAWCLPEEELRRSLSWTNSHSSSGQPEGASHPEVDTASLFARKGGRDVMKALNDFNSGHFVLVSGSLDIKDRQSSMQALAYPPWIAVYDFDFRGRDRGLLNALESSMEKTRHLSIGTWMTPVRPLTERATQWWSLRGRRDVPDSTIPDSSHWAWLDVVGEQLEKLCLELQRFSEDYTVLKFLVLWPGSELEALCMHQFLRKVKEHVKKVRFVLCSTDHDGTQLQSKPATMLRWDFESDPANTKIFNVDLLEVCSAIENIQKKKWPLEKFHFLLPSDSEETVIVNEEIAADLRVDLEVLYLKTPYTKRDQTAMEKVADNFFRGGCIDWHAYYAMGRDSLDVERDIQKGFLAQVQDCIKKCKTEMVTLYHNPGAGGSTLARRVLWELHEKTPCVHVKQRTGSSTEDVVNKLKLVHDLTGLPVLALIDGDDEPKVKQLQKYLQNSYVIIMHVKRYPHSIKRPGHDIVTNDFYLPDTVSKTESERLLNKLIARCGGDQAKVRELQDLHAALQQAPATQTPMMFQYGMTVYAHEFRGIKAFVRGYLQLDENPTSAMKSWQTCLGYLSLVFYYGQSSLPLQIFASIKGKPAGHTVTLGDFPDQFKVFVVSDDNEGRQNYVRICHFLVATEILEQILNRSSIKSPECTRSLSTMAKRQLKPLCLQFIAIAANKKARNLLAAQTVTYIMAKTFIFRDYIEGQDLEKIEAGQPMAKQKFSQVILDMDPSPPYAGRLEVMHKLCNTFPHDPNFRAHLGRCYSLCRPEEEEEADRHFEKALAICRGLHGNIDVDAIDDKAKLTLLHIFHMYGMVFQRRLSRYTGWYMGGKPDFRTTTLSVEERLQTVFLNAKRACENFAQARLYTPPGEEDCYTYMNEIHVRLQAADFIRRFYEGGSEAFLAEYRDNEMVRFYKHSTTEVQDLIMECYNVVLLDNGRPLEQYVSWFNTAFRKCAGQMRALKPDAELNGLEALRLSITTKKLQFCRDEKQIVSVEADMEEEEIQSLVDDYEGIFRHTQHGVVQDGDSRRKLELDYKDWVLAIRHRKLKKIYTLEEVLEKVQQWHDNLGSLTSTFYLFVLNTLTGIGSLTQTGNAECLEQANALLADELHWQSRKKVRSKWPREWLGAAHLPGIKRLVPSSQVTDLKERRVKDKSARRKLAICKGTICSPNRRSLAGFIDLDLSQDMTLKESVKVFFVPRLAKQDGDTDLCGQKYAGKRVEFYLAFTLANGFEAYSVKLLKKYECRRCKNMIEMTSLDSETVCHNCGQVCTKPKKTTHTTEV